MANEHSVNYQPGTSRSTLWTQPYRPSIDPRALLGPVYGPSQLNLHIHFSN